MTGGDRHGHRRRLVSRSAVAAGPISRAVERIAPMVTADSDTARASATR